MNCFARTLSVTYPVARNDVTLGMLHNDESSDTHRNDDTNKN